MRATFSCSGGSSWRSYNHSRAAPLASCAPTTEPADVPTTRSALLRSTPAAAAAGGSRAPPRLGQSGQDADLPGDARDSAAAEDEGGPLVAHRHIFTEPGAIHRL